MRTRRLKYARVNFSNEIFVDEEEHFKHVFGLGLGENLRRNGSKFGTTKRRPEFTGSY